VTPFDKAIEAIRLAGYHNHRREGHSDVVSTAIFEDLVAECAALREDVAQGKVGMWLNVSSPGDRSRKVDLFVGESNAEGEPDIARVRIAVENKSVITAHRNRTNRFDDLQKVLGGIHGARPEAILIATVLVGLSERVLNVPDHVHKFYREEREEEFESKVLPRLSSGDQSLWSEFSWAVSKNRPRDPGETVAHLRTIPTRNPAQTHLKAYDTVLLVPVVIDNVNPPSLPRPNALGIDVDADYKKLIHQTCAAYTARWHL
jgi:hypothetical protein